MSFARARAFIVFGVLAVAAVVFMIVALVRDSQADVVAGAGCPASAPRANIKLPAGPEQITVKVLNGTRTPGLAQRVTNDFKNRQFKVQKPAEDKKRVKDVAVLRFGPEAVGAAQLLRAYFLNQADLEYNARRKGAAVDIVLGTNFQQLATSTEVKQSLSIIGEPELPPGACVAPAQKA